MSIENPDLRKVPLMPSALFETHCHLDYLPSEQLQQCLQLAREHKIERIVTIAVSPDNQARVRQLVTEDPMIFGTQGVHPHEADKVTEHVLADIEQGLSLAKMVAVGEIGLDYYYQHAQPQVQQRVFARQLELAIRHQLPVVIHSRDADQDTMAMLREYAPDLRAKGVIHSFTSGIELAECALDLGFKLGFNGIVTFNKAANVRDILAATPLSSLVIETDSPYLTPVPYRGRANAPYYLPCVAQFIAEFKQVDLHELLPILYANSLDLFPLSRSL